MRAWEVQNRFGLDNLRCAERERPIPAADEVLVKLEAASLNYRDLLMVEGQYNPRQPLPFIPLSDGAGTVVEVGDSVEGLKVGQRVCPLFAQDWADGPMRHPILQSTLGGPLDGTLTQYFRAKASGLIATPEHLDSRASSTLPCAALTAWSALFVHGDLQPGQTVLLLGTGGVSIFALQFAVAAGAHVIITSSQDEKLARARELGAAETINYRDIPDWGREVRRITGKRGVDLVVEVGGAGTFKQSARAVTTGGRIALIGVLAGGRSEVDLTPILMNQVRVQGVFVGHASSFRAMNHFMSEHQIYPIIDRSFPFSRAPEAFSYAKEGAHIGKIILEDFH